MVLEPGTLHPVDEAEVLLFKPPAEFALLNFNRANTLVATTTATGAFQTVPLELTEIK